MADTFTKETFWAELEEVGEEEVRVRIATHRYGNVSDKRRLADEWVNKKDRERLGAAGARIDASNAETLRVARSAKNAAWAAAIAAIIAVIFAVITWVSSRGGATG